jgi:hypothetical protein
MENAMKTRMLNHDREAGNAASLMTMHRYWIEGATNSFWLKLG